MTHQALEANIIHVLAGEVPNVSVNCTGVLDGAEIITGTPTVLEQETADLTIDNKVTNSSAIVIKGVTVAIGQAIKFRAAGFVAGRSYRVRLTMTTNSTPAATRIGDVVIVCAEK